MMVHKASEAPGRVVAQCGSGGYQLAERWVNVTCPDCLKRAPRVPPKRVKVYIDLNDWWVGVYRGDNNIYICPLPTVVIRVRRRG